MLIKQTCQLNLKYDKAAFGSRESLESFCSVKDIDSVIPIK